MSVNPEALQQEITALRQENATLLAENVRLEAEQARLENELREREALIAELRRQLFGPKADRLSPEQENQLAEVVAAVQEPVDRPAAVSLEVLVEESTVEPPRARTPRRRHPLPAHLELQEVVLEPEGLCACGHCGQMPPRIGQEVTEEIDLIPARLIKRRIIRPKYGACRCGALGVQIAELPPRLLPQSRLGLGLAVHILLSHFDDHVSYYTLERIFRERHGVIVPRQQMTQWVGKCAELLQPVAELMFRQMGLGGYLQVDETPVKVLDPEVKGKAATGWLWVFAVPGGDVFFSFETTRGAEPVRRRLADFRGTMQTDAYEVYESVRRQTEGLERIGCAAHARRRFAAAAREGDLRALDFLAAFRRLYQMEEQARNLESAARHELRQEQGALGHWQAMRDQAEQLRPQLLPKSTLGKAVHYLLNEYEALTGYLASGVFEIDNNLIENALRPTCVGKKRWLFIGDPEAGWRSAVAYSLIVSCRRRAINPQEYLMDLLAHLPGLTNQQLDQWLPDAWQKRHPSDTS